MSRLSTGNAANVGDESKSELSEVIAELRNALGAIPEVASLYGRPEGMADAYDEYDMRGDVGEMKDAYTTPVLNPDRDDLGESEEVEGEEVLYVSGIEGLHAEQPDAEENEAQEDQAEQPNAYFSYENNAEDQPPAPVPELPVAQLAPVAAVNPLAFDPDAHRNMLNNAQAWEGINANYEKVRKETDHRLAKLARFLPDKVREALTKKFDEAVKLARHESNEALTAATEALTKLQESLDAKAPELRTAENGFLRKQVQRALDTEGGVLLKDDKKGFVEQFAALDKDLPAEAGEAETQLNALRKLAADIDGAIQSRLKAVSDLCVDYERLKPIVLRALSIKSDRHGELEKAAQEIETGFAGQFVAAGLSTDDIRTKLLTLEKTVHDIFKDFTVNDALDEQKKSLPASPDSLKPKGAALGKGAFGEVFELKNDGDTKLVGKSFQSGDSDAKKEMEHEAEIYARIGEHPNIAQCYGIHQVEGKSMLVMDKIEGKDVEKVFDDLNKRYRKKRISREEYLAATQHIMKGMLMGLAHMEAMGLVHKDIKGDNVKFDTRTNQAVLIDMGLAQAEGEHENPKAFFPIAPPEHFMRDKNAHDKVVTSFWDSFTVGKMLFEEMERDDKSGVRQALVTGNAPLEKKQTQDLFPHVQKFVQGAKDAVKRTDTGEFEAQTDAQGQLVGQSLKPADTPKEAAKAGKYGAGTLYVDFMNRLTHPDPKQRMTPSEALKHPFMTDTFMSGEELDKVFGVATDRQKPAVEDEEDEKDDEGPRINVQELADSYWKDSKEQPSARQSREDEEVEEQNEGPRIDTDALAEAYHKDAKQPYDKFGKESAEDESDESKGPRRFSKEELDEAYFGKKSVDDEFEDEAEEKIAPYDPHRGKGD